MLTIPASPTGQGGLTMKKFIAFAILSGLFLHWDSVQSFISGDSGISVPNDRVVLYATEWCKYCEKTRNLFAKHKISYVEIDIEKSEQGHREYKKLGGRGVPVVNAHGTVIHGYAPQQILEAARRN